MDDLYKERYDEENGFIDFNELDFDHLDKPDGMDEKDFKNMLFVQCDNDNYRQFYSEEIQLRRDLQKELE